jgi:hypothetical protein
MFALFLWESIMREVRLLFTLLGVMALMQGFARDAAADDGAGIARRCTTRAKEILDNCKEANDETVRKAVHLIKRLKENGKIEEAEAVANRAITVIEERQTRCKKAVAELCRECVAKLKELGAEELAEKVKTFCERVAKGIDHSTESSIKAIRRALDA